MAGGFFTYGMEATYKAIEGGGPFSWKLPAQELGGSDSMKLLYEFMTGTKWWEMNPDNSVITSGPSGHAVSLVNPGIEYVVYLRSGSSVSVDLSGVSGNLKVKWFDTKDGDTFSQGTVSGGGTEAFTKPGGIDGEGVLHLYVFVDTYAYFDWDSHPDVLWRNTVGGNAMWYMEAGGRLVKGWAGVPSAGTSWQVGGVGDFDADGVPDIFWRHTGGSNAIWYMDVNGTSVKGWASVPSVGTSWQVGKIADFDADGVPDIFWRHTGGSNAIWYMDTNGTSVKGWASVPSAGTSWDIGG
jgi:hypothetical protein